MNNILPTLPWLPSYMIKKHSRAKSVKLMITHSRHLKITLPPRFNIKKLPAIIEEHKHWIIQQLEKLPPITDELPAEIIFNSINESWKIIYMHCLAKPNIVIRPNHEMVIIGNMDDKIYCKKILIAWIKEYSKKYLISHLKKISQLTQLNYTKILIRNQATVWGSCTSKKHINLNYKLIFLPFSLVQYVMIHELCHTKFLNHSKKFWDLVAIYDPNWQAHRKELRQGNNFIPPEFH